MTGLEIPIAVGTALIAAVGVAATGVGSAATAGTLGYKIHQDRKKKLDQQHLQQAFANYDYPISTPQPRNENMSVMYATSGGGQVHFGADGSMFAGGSRPGDISWGYTTMQRTNVPPHGHQPSYFPPQHLPIRSPVPIGMTAPTEARYAPALHPGQMPYGHQIPFQPVAHPGQMPYGHQMLFQPVAHPVYLDIPPPPYSVGHDPGKKLKKQKSFWT